MCSTGCRWLDEPRPTLAFPAHGCAVVAYLHSGRVDRKVRPVGPDQTAADTAELVNLIEGMALRRPPPKIAQVHREAVRIAEERGWPVNWRFIWPLLGTLNGTVFKHQFECRACGR